MGLQNKRISATDLMRMSHNEFAWTMLCLREQVPRLLGVPWQKYVRWWWDEMEMTYVFQYE